MTRLNGSDKESSKFATRKWCVVHNQIGTDHGQGNINGTSVKFKTKYIKSSLCNYSDAYILVTVDITILKVMKILMIIIKLCPIYNMYNPHKKRTH